MHLWFEAWIPDCVARVLTLPLLPSLNNMVLRLKDTIGDLYMLKRYLNKSPLSRKHLENA